MRRVPGRLRLPKALVAALALGASGAVLAQATGGIQAPTTTDPNAPRSVLPRSTPGGTTLPGAVSAQPTRIGTPDPNRPAFAWQPGILSTLSYSDNIDLGEGGTARNGTILEVAPYVDMRFNSPRAIGAFGYRARGLKYWNSQVFDTEFRNDLRGAIDAAITDETLRVYASAYVFDINRNPFGATTVDPGSRSSTRTLYRSFEVSPYLSGDVGQSMEYVLRYRLNHIDPGGTLLSSTGSALLGEARSPTERLGLGWTSRVATTQYTYENDFDYRNSLIELLGTYALSPTLRLGLGANYAASSTLTDSDGNRSGFGPSASFDWAPAPRTLVNGRWSGTYYTNVANVRAVHATGRSTFGLTFDRGVRDGNESSLLYFDPLRVFGGSAVRGGVGALSPVGGALDQQGLLDAAGRPLSTAFTQSPIVRIEALIASWGYATTRTGTLATAYMNNQRPAVIVPGFTNVADFDQVGVSLRWSYQLTPRQILQLGGLLQTTESNTLRTDTTVTSASAGFRYLLTPNLTGILNYRFTRQRIDGGTFAGYDENLVQVGVDYRF